MSFESSGVDNVKGRLMRARLKLFVERAEEQQAVSAEKTTALALGDFARVIADAVTWDRTWLQDFADEHVVLSQDLYEIIRLYDEIHQAQSDVA
jgi:hypothetical protein